MLKTTFTSGGDRSRRCEIWTATQASLPTLGSIRGSTSRRGKTGKATATRHTRNIYTCVRASDPAGLRACEQALKQDLRHGRRWSILVDSFVAESGDIISRAWPRAPLALRTCHLPKNITLPFTHGKVWQSASQSSHYRIHGSFFEVPGPVDPPLTYAYVEDSEMMRPAAESLVHYSKLWDDKDLSMIAEGFKQYI